MNDHTTENDLLLIGTESMVPREMAAVVVNKQVHPMVTMDRYKP